MKRTLFVLVLCLLPLAGCKRSAPAPVCPCTPQPKPAPLPPVPLTPPPEPTPAPKPKPTRPWGTPVQPVGCADVGQAEAGVQKGGPVHGDGTQVAVDLPQGERKANIASNGAGCCVFRSLDHAARWQNVPALYGMPEWMVSKHITGGGYPSKVDKLIPQISKDRSAATPAYLQYEGTDLAVLRLAIKTGRCPCITWQSNHMINLVHLDDKWAVCLDNNAIGADQLYWMDIATFKSKWCSGGKGWAVVLLSPGPPPIPTNASGPAPLPGPAVPVPPIDPNNKRPVADSYEWIVAEDAPDQVLLWYRGVQVGGYSFTWDHYRPRLAAGKWGPPCAPPVPLPLYGVEPWEQPRRERFSLCGREVSREQALAIIGADLADDSAQLHLTVAGDEALRSRVLADLATAPELAPWKDKLRVQGYPTGHWALLSPLSGLRLQAPADKAGRGRVLHYQADYAGPADLAKALRRADPLYDPSKDPDLRRPTPPPGPAPAPLTPIIEGTDLAPFALPAAVGGILGIVALSKRKNTRTQRSPSWPNSLLTRP